MAVLTQIKQHLARGYSIFLSVLFYIYIYTRVCVYLLVRADNGNVTCGRARCNNELQYANAKLTRSKSFGEFLFFSGQGKTFRPRPGPIPRLASKNSWSSRMGEKRRGADYSWATRVQTASGSRFS